MKKFFTILSLVSVMTSSAHAVNVRADVQINRLQSTAQACNGFGRPIMCDMEVTGITYYRMTPYAYMNDVVIYPGQCGYVHVYTNPSDPFINAKGDAQCRFL